MFSIIIATHDSERALVPTLAALVPGAIAGIVREVIVADAGSADQTERVADIAGCRFVASRQPLGARLRAAAASARGDWLMFLEPGCVPGPTWIDETAAFVEQSVDRRRAAVFSPAAEGVLARLRRLAPFISIPDYNLTIPGNFYQELGGHPDGAAPGRGLMRRIGRRRIVTLRTTVTRTTI